MLANFYLIDGHVKRAANQRRILFEFLPRAKIKDYRILARLLLLVQFIYGDPCHPQLTQQPVPPVIPPLPINL